MRKHCLAALNSYIDFRADPNQNFGGLPPTPSPHIYLVLLLFDQCDARLERRRTRYPLWSRLGVFVGSFLIL
jgi:hypothetical protein